MNSRTLFLVLMGGVVAAFVTACRSPREAGRAPQDPSIPISEADPNQDSPPGEPDRTVFQPSPQEAETAEQTDTTLQAGDGGTDGGVDRDSGVLPIRDVPNAPPDPRRAPRSGGVVRNRDAGL